jgi:outer membrane protein assembly factor BamE (lipoprotein component of BamABCDE complex)
MPAEAGVRTMQQRLKSHVLACAGLMLSLALAGCGNLSKVDDHGQSASPVWPDIALATRPQGSYPDLNQLAMVKAGMNKDQLYDLLGRPHFQEGFFMVREWDYLFHVQTPAGDELCQYKVLFDRDRTARSFYWRTPSCEADVKKAMLAAVNRP